MTLVNPFPVNVSILYPLKTPENFRVFGVFRGYKMGKLTRNGLILNKASCLYIFFNILEYIWWPLHSSFLFMGKRGRKIICDLKSKVIYLHGLPDMETISATVYS